MITGINHITLSVREVSESFDFYTEVLGFQPVTCWPKGAYLLAGELWVALLIDEQVRPGLLPEFTHLAFTVAPDAFTAMSEHIRQAGAGIWQENWTEGDSLYFLDPNGHKLEIHSSDRAARLKSARENPWEGLVIYDEPER
ncbi:MAG: VOC family protein [Ardenticatenales bacterium]|nr:VOC family protein [Ardenticatenales bacterium]